MAQIQFVRGTSEKIDMNITPFQDGRIYFTPDNGDLYIDATVNGSDKRIHVNEQRIPAVTAADNDKFAVVVDGAWTATTVPSAEDHEF